MLDLIFVAVGIEFVSIALVQYPSDEISRLVKNRCSGAPRRWVCRADPNRPNA
jgi:hypothetical protein